MAAGFRRADVLRRWREHADTPLPITLITAAEPDERHQFDTVPACRVVLEGQADAGEPTVADRTMEQNIPIVPQMNANRK